MEKLLNWMLSCIILSLFAVPAAWAIDYAVLSTQELYELKGAVGNASQSEQNAYEDEWQKRLQSLTAEEKTLYTENPAQSDSQENRDENKKQQKPFTPGRGYDQQGTGGVLYGGGSPDHDLR